MLRSGGTSRGRKGGFARAAIAGAVVGLVGALAFVMTANAAPAPSATIVLNCDRGVPYQFSPGEGVAGLHSVTFYRGPNGTGRVVGHGPALECPTPNGGRVRAKVNLDAPAASVTVNCWNGTILIGGTTGNLPLSGDCIDNTTPGVGHYATFQVSGRPAAPTNAGSLCSQVGGTYSTDPGSDVTGAFPGSRVVWTCNDWPSTYVPIVDIADLWLPFCNADGGDNLAATSNLPPGGARRGITCFDVYP